MTREPQTKAEQELKALAISEAHKFMNTHCHECGAEVPEDAKRCYIFDHPYCDECWNRLLPPDPKDYHRMMNAAFDVDTYGVGWPD